MQINISCRHFEIPDSLRDRTYKKLEKIEKFSPKILSVDSIFEKNGSRIIVELRAKVGRKNLAVIEKNYDMYKAIDVAADKLIRMIKDYRDKRKATRRKSE
ncbi:MAG TPA: ribosome-associated translation inhibitor RaiA [bacterium (Candidatus Stahlbacteria)]|nr:ribosome-associated translation inhibitor RaiA [Candidatus Stahlbacteria bacterium]